MILPRLEDLGTGQLGERGSLLDLDIRMCASFLSICLGMAWPHCENRIPAREITQSTYNKK